MQNNCNPLIPWKTFLMRKIWQFSAPSKRNLGLVTLGADVAVPGLCLSDYWAFWTPGTLAAAAAAAPLWEGRDRKGRRKESSDEGEWIWCVCVHIRIVNFVMDVRSPCLASAKSCHLVPSPPTDTNLPVAPHARVSPICPHSWDWLLRQFLWVCECQHLVGIRHQRNQNVTKRCETPLQRACPAAPLKYCMWYHSFVCT